MRKIITTLWFDTQAEEAANVYVDVFDDSALLGLTRNTGAGPGAQGTVLTAAFRLQG